ncbi:MAG: DUF2283 domain-containing protein [Proteobacteria bacterium]|nr:MAG: DUF2283 domain-containing protein [Pseudomonadota bacterium]
MKIIYDPEVDVLRIRLSDAQVEESDEETPGVILDFDEEGQVVGFEILNASTRVQNPRSVEWALAA